MSIVRIKNQSNRGLKLNSTSHNFFIYNGKLHAQFYNADNAMHFYCNLENGCNIVDIDGEETVAPVDVSIEYTYIMRG